MLAIALLVWFRLPVYPCSVVNAMASHLYLGRRMPMREKHHAFMHRLHPYGCTRCGSGTVSIAVIIYHSAVSSVA